MTVAQQMDWEAQLVEPVDAPELEEEARRALGVVPPFLGYTASCPWLTRMMFTGAAQSGVLAHLDRDLADLVFLAVSQDNSCRYCYASQRTLLRLGGVPEQRIRQLEETSFAVDLSAQRKAALDFARCVSRSDPAPTRSDVEGLRSAGYTDSLIKELAAFAAVGLAANRITTLLAIPTEDVEAFPDRWYIRLLRPLITWRLRRNAKVGRDQPLGPGELSGPWAYLRKALAPVPYAHQFGNSIDEYWASPILSRRLKALVAAVIARGLSAPRAERDATGLLADEGLKEADVEEILAHLGSPQLDRLETLALPFARDTIRSQGVTLQRRARDVRKELSAAEYLELVGVAAFANAAARLDFLVDAV